MRDNEYYFIINNMLGFFPHDVLQVFYKNTKDLVFKLIWQIFRGFYEI
jgi:hypothetical protein